MEPSSWAMSDLQHREKQLRRLNEPHIAPITALVDRLRAVHGSKVPYVDPDTGGINAKVLFVLKRPGPRAEQTSFLSAANPDQTARNHLDALAEVGIPYSETVMWNVVPWFGPVKEQLTSAEISAGAKWLLELLNLLKQVRSIVFVGRAAQQAMSAVRLGAGIKAFTSPHPSPQNLNTSPTQRNEMIRIYRDAWDHARNGYKGIANGADSHAVHSSIREKVLEHIFLGDLLRCLWRRGIRDIEVLRAEVDCGGYDLVIECNGVVRHIQLKASFLGSATSRQKINVGLGRKPSGCVVWLRFAEQTMELGPFLWFGAKPGESLPSLGDKVARHTKGNSAGEKTERPNIRVVNRASFRELQDMDALVTELFGV